MSEPAFWIILGGITLMAVLFFLSEFARFRKEDTKMTQAIEFGCCGAYANEEDVVWAGEPGDSFATCPTDGKATELWAYVDVTVKHDGTVLFLVPENEQAEDWVAKNIGRGGSYQPHWPTVLVDHQGLEDLIQSMEADGLVVRR